MAFILDNLVGYLYSAALFYIVLLGNLANQHSLSKQYDFILN